MLFLVGIVMVSCGEENLVDPSTQKPKGEVTFQISSDGGSGSGKGTSSSPAVVQSGDTLNMTISQTSSYSDPDGSVFTCEPQAIIRLSAFADTLFTKSFKTLTDIRLFSSVNSQTTEREKQTKKTLQTFTIGGKEVIFDLAYDIYNHVNSQQKLIEMPYIKVNAASFGTAKTEETRAANEASVSLAGIRIRPHASPTRSKIVDTTAYDVNVTFNLEIESVNTKEAQKQTLVFEVAFLAVVETTTEYPDPQSQFSYQFEVVSGTTRKVTPFTINRSNEPMKLRWQQTFRYDYFSMSEQSSKTILQESEASVTVTTAAQDTLWAANKTELGQFTASEAVVTTEGSDSQTTTGQKTFQIAGKDINVCWSYNANRTMQVEGKDVVVPHLEFDEPQIVNADIRILRNITLNGQQVQIYEVTARLSQKVRSVGTPESSEETIEYHVTYTGAIEVRLLKVVYRKDWDWVEPHDNIILNYHAKVHRDRIYSTGETFTDTFIDYGHVAFISATSTFSKNGEEVIEGIKFFCSNHTRTNIADSIVTVSNRISVPDLSLVKRWTHPDTGEEEYVYNTNSPAGTWAEYQQSKIYTGLDISLTGVEIEGADSTSTMPTGWYFSDPTYVHERRYIYLNRDVPLERFMLKIRVYDQFLVIDGQMINFLEFRDHVQFNFKEESIVMPNGAPGLVATYDAHMEFLGRNFYGSVIDTIYQQEPNPSSALPSIRQNVRKPSSSWQKAGATPKRQSIQLPPPYRDLPTFEYGGDPFTH